VITSDAFVTRFQMIGVRKGMAELDKGGAGQGKEFWDYVAVHFHEYVEDNNYGALLLTSAYDKKM
jgi:vacuolar-type H+-ATPase subunit F/Vma7